MSLAGSKIFFFFAHHEISYYREPWTSGWELGSGAVPGASSQQQLVVLFSLDFCNEKPRFGETVAVEPHKQGCTCASGVPRPIGLPAAAGVQALKLRSRDEQGREGRCLTGSSAQTGHCNREATV